MDNTLEELRALIEASSFESPSPAITEKNILNNPESLLKYGVPPLDIVLYATRMLLALPNSSGVSDVPDILDFATTIESYRKLALQKVDDALKIHRSYQANDDDTTKLADEKLERLHEYQRNDPTLRNTYIQLVLQYCQLDIYHICTSDPPRAAELALRLGEYFPESELSENARAESPRLFHYGLTDVEREAVRLHGGDSYKFVSALDEWAVAHQTSGRTVASLLQTPEFAMAFPCEIHPPTLRNTVELYMDAVERMVNELQEMFPQN